MKNSTKVLSIDSKKLTVFLGLTANLRKDGAVLQHSGNWLVMESPYKWGDKLAGSDQTAGEAIQTVKDAGFKSAFVRGGRLGLNVKDVAKAA